MAKPSRRERDAILKLEALSLLSKEENGAWDGMRIRHASGSAERLLVAWDRGDTRFMGMLIDGRLEQLAVHRLAGARPDEPVTDPFDEQPTGPPGG